MSNPMDSTRTKWLIAGFWISTAIFALEMSFTAYYELLRMPEAAQAFARLGFPDSWFRVELSWAKVAGVAVLLLPMVPARLKEWAYAGFAINLVSAFIAHLSVGDGPKAWAPSAITSVLWGLSYFFWRRLEAIGSGLVTDAISNATSTAWINQEHRVTLAMLAN